MGIARTQTYGNSLNLKGLHAVLVGPKGRTVSLAPYSTQVRELILGFRKSKIQQKGKQNLKHSPKHTAYRK